MTNRVLSVANAFIDLAHREGLPISNMKLQKLLYFLQGHSLGMYGRPVMDEAPEAWQYGPVFSSAYHAFKQFGAAPITQRARHFNPFDGSFHELPPVDPVDYQMLVAVWNAYKDRSPIQLSDMSHVSNGPWAKAFAKYRNADISPEDMQEFFRPQQPVVQ